MKNDSPEIDPGEAGTISGAAREGFSPCPVLLNRKQVGELQRLGIQLLAFLRSCNDLYAMSCDGRQPGWVARVIDQGRRGDWTEFGRDRRLRTHLPALLEPELSVCKEGWILSQIRFNPIDVLYREPSGDSSSWESPLTPGYGNQIRDQIAPLLEHGAVYSVASGAKESSALKQLANELGPSLIRLEDPEKLAGLMKNSRVFYFGGFEEIVRGNFQPSHLQPFLPVAASNGWAIKPQAEEHLWLALLRIKTLWRFWRRSLSDRHLKALLKIIAPSWILDPTAVPPQAEILDLGARAFHEIPSALDKKQNFSIRPSRESGPDGEPKIFHSLTSSTTEFCGELLNALEFFESTPRILMKAPDYEQIRHPFRCGTTGEIKIFETRMQLRPLDRIQNGSSILAGVRAAIESASSRGVFELDQTLWTTVIGAEN